MSITKYSSEPTGCAGKIKHRVAVCDLFVWFVFSYSSIELALCGDENIYFFMCSYDTEWEQKEMSYLKHQE